MTRRPGSAIPAIDFAPAARPSAHAAERLCTLLPHDACLLGDWMVVRRYAWVVRLVVAYGAVVTPAARLLATRRAPGVVWGLRRWRPCRIRLSLGRRVRPCCRLARRSGRRWSVRR